MRENMIYNPGIYQLRESTLERMLDIIHKRRQSRPQQVVFFGDSLIEFWNLNKYITSVRNLYNCGIAGATTDQLLAMVDEAVIKYQPQTVVLLVGTNDLGNTVMHSPREIAVNVNHIAEVITHNLPHAELIILSPLPALREQTYPQVKGIRDNTLLKSIYDLEKECVLSSHTLILNPFDLFINHEDYYEDGLHLNEKGYQVLSSFLQSHFTF